MGNVLKHEPLEQALRTFLTSRRGRTLCEGMVYGHNLQCRINNALHDGARIMAKADRNN